MSKSMKKISEGQVKDRGVTWFPELVDKSKDYTFTLFWYCTCIWCAFIRKVSKHAYTGV